MADEGVYGKFYGHDADPMADEFEIGRVPSVDPEMGHRRASLLVGDLCFIAIQFSLRFLSSVVLQA